MNHTMFGAVEALNIISGISGPNRCYQWGKCVQGKLFFVGKVVASEK